MSSKMFSVLAVVCVLAMALGSVASDADASTSGTYKDQLDDNGRGLYSQLESQFKEGSEDPQTEMKVSFVMTVPVVEKTREDVQSYADGLVENVLTAYYMTDPTPIWLWDLPATDAVEVKFSTTTEEIGGQEYLVLTSLSFKLSAPSGYGTVESMKTAMDEVSAKIVKVSGESIEDKVSAINDILKGIVSIDDPENGICTIHDALVSGKSSSAGVAAAFTALCVFNGVTAMTVNGTVLKDQDGDMVPGYWNYVLSDGTWYASDCTFNSSDSKNCLMAGVSTPVAYDDGSIRFGSTHVADVGFWNGISLSAPALAQSGVEWSSTEPGLFDRYGAYVFGAVVIIIVIAVLVHATRVGDV